MATTYYLDTSALGKRYVNEIGSTWTRALTTPAAGHAIVTARITMAEIYSVLARRKREGSVPTAACIVAAQAFALHSVTEYQFIEMDMTIISEARDLLDRYPLRAYDAVQLGSAIVANHALILHKLPPLIFVSADDRLIQAALAEGLATENPNLHP